MSNQSDLFQSESASTLSSGRRDSRPMADRLRPQRLDEVQGHERWVSPGGLLHEMANSGHLRSLIFWGPPGCGKTTLARILAQRSGLGFVPLSAVTASIKEIKEMMEQARFGMERTGKPTLLFVDEIHRFNRSQQDAFLPYVESGQIILIGATTENPSFEINSALLSRVEVVILEGLSVESVVQILDSALQKSELNSEIRQWITPRMMHHIAEIAQGDARAALNRLEACLFAIDSKRVQGHLSEEAILQSITRILPRFDKNRDQHYDFISALHKSLRNSDVQASLYWLACILEGGEDPLFVARRLIRFASEDIGLAEPQCLTQAVAAKDACHFVGMPECSLALAQVVVMLATAPKSNALYQAWKAIEQDLRDGHRYDPPLHLRNAPTELMKSAGYGHGYQYAHDFAEGTSAMNCLPELLKGRNYFRPRGMGFEKTILDRLNYWKQLKEKKGDESGS